MYYILTFVLFWFFVHSYRCGVSQNCAWSVFVAWELQSLVLTWLESTILWGDYKLSCGFERSHMKDLYESRVWYTTVTPCFIRYRFVRWFMVRVSSLKGSGQNKDTRILFYWVEWLYWLPGRLVVVCNSDVLQIMGYFVDFSYTVCNVQKKVTKCSQDADGRAVAQRNVYQIQDFVVEHMVEPYNVGVLPIGSLGYTQSDCHPGSCCVLWFEYLKHVFFYTVYWQCSADFQFGLHVAPQINGKWINPASEIREVM